MLQVCKYRLNNQQACKMSQPKGEVGSMLRGERRLPAAMKPSCIAEMELKAAQLHITTTKARPPRSSSNPCLKVNHSSINKLPLTSHVVVLQSSSSRSKCSQEVSLHLSQ